MFSLNEKVVYPGHGVATINRIIERLVGGRKMVFYELVIINNNTTVLIPVDRLIESGIHPVSLNRIDELFKTLAKPFGKKLSEIPTANWTKKSKFYLGGLRTGNHEAVCNIYKDLQRSALLKDLSYSEKILLQKTENLLVEEVIAATGMSEGEARERLRSTAKKAVAIKII